MDMRQAVDRIWRVGNIADRYERNIVQRASLTNAYQNTVNQLVEARRNRDAEAARKAYDANAKVVNKAYARSIYMGLTNG